MLAALGLAALVGGMLFFAAIMTPLVFTKLPPEVAGPFIRAAFPRYYAFMVVTAGLGGLGFLLRGQNVSAIVLWVILLAAVWAWFWLIPYLNAAREAGNMVAFDRGHKLSVWLNGAELVAAVWVLVRVALRV